MTTIAQSIAEENDMKLIITATKTTDGYIIDDNGAEHPTADPWGRASAPVPPSSAKGLMDDRHAYYQQQGISVTIAQSIDTGHRVFDTVVGEFVTIPAHWSTDDGCRAGDVTRSDGRVALVVTGPHGRWLAVKPGTLKWKRMPGRKRPSHYGSLAAAIAAADAAWPPEAR